MELVAGLALTVECFAITKKLLKLRNYTACHNNVPKIVSRHKGL